MALTSVPLATLVTIGAAPVIVLGVDRVTGRPAGRFAAATTVLALMPLAQLAGGLGFRPEPAAIGLLIALGTGPTAVAYTLYFRGLRSAAASTAALLALLEPLTGAILAAVLLAERLGATGIAGAAIIATAVILTVRANRGRPEDVRGSGGAAGEPAPGRPAPATARSPTSGSLLVAPSAISRTGSMVVSIC